MVLQQVIADRSVLSLAANGCLYYQESRLDKPSILCTYSGIRKVFTVGGKLFALQGEQEIFLVAAGGLEEVSLA